MVITFSDELVEGVAPCSGFLSHIGTHIHTTIIVQFRTEGYDLLEKLETSSKTK